jgi:hypothetical protein
VSTNYYWHPVACAHCGRGGEPVHIGKSSARWCFALHVIPERGLRILDDWHACWKTTPGRIVNEYSDQLSIDEMLKVITDRSWPGAPMTKKDRVRNQAVLGPNNLLRVAVGSGGCVGHGLGPWDLIIGEFSWCWDCNNITYCALDCGLAPWNQDRAPPPRAQRQFHYLLRFRRWLGWPIDRRDVKWMR